MIHRTAVLAAGLLIFGQMAAAQSADSVFGRNLVVNGNADAGSATNNASEIPGWKATGTPVVKAYPKGTKSDWGVPADHGANFFTAGSANKTTLSQTIDLTPGATTIDAGNVTFDLSACLGGVRDDEDNARVIVSFANDKKEEIGTATAGPLLRDDREKQTVTVLRKTIGQVPRGARTATVTIDLEKTSGSFVSASADDVSLLLREDPAPQSFVGPNLVVNPGAEDGGPWNTRDNSEVKHWSADGYFTLEWYNPKGSDQTPTTAGPKDRGTNYFFGGEDPKSAAFQDVYIAPATKLIDDKYELDYTLSAWMGGIERQRDTPTVTAEFRDWSGKVLQTAELAPVTPAERKFAAMLVQRSKSGGVPPETKYVRITMTMTRADGSTNDAAVDNVSLTLARRPRPPKK